jgi:hypothetical protein
MFAISRSKAVLAGLLAAVGAVTPVSAGLIILPTSNVDLEVTSFSVRGTIAPNAALTFTWGVRNRSTKSITSPWDDAIYLSTSGTSIANAVALGSADSPRSLAAASGYTRTLKITLPTVPNNKYYLHIVADAGSRISEISETNNVETYGPFNLSSGGSLPRVLPEIDDLFVSLDRGSDDDGLGTEDAPLRGLDAAITHAATYATATRAVRVRIGAGVYDSALTLPDSVELVGSNPFDPGETIIQPSFTKIKGNSGAGIRLAGEKNALRNLTLQVDPTIKGRVDFSLLSVDNAQAIIDNVIFDGSNSEGGIGIEAFDAGASDTNITRCVFKRLENGLVTLGAGPKISRNTFLSVEGDAIVVGDGSVKGGFVMPNLGSTLDVTSGFNTFGKVTGQFVKNNTDELLMAENNNWNGIVQLDVLDSFIDGPVDFDPPVTYISMQSSVFVTVKEDGGDVPIYNAEVDLNPNALPPISENTDGVYIIPIVPPGEYNINVIAPGYFETQETFVVEPGNPSTEVVVNLSADGTIMPNVSAVHSSDTDSDNSIGLAELLRVIQLFNGSRIRCQPGSEDGYASGVGDTSSCDPHVVDYSPTDWRISLSELLRLIQLYTLSGYHPCEDGEDGYCPGES